VQVAMQVESEQNESMEALKEYGSELKKHA
jgi:hypothetical protein